MIVAVGKPNPIRVHRLEDKSTRYSGINNHVSSTMIRMLTAMLRRSIIFARGDPSKQRVIALRFECGDQRFVQ